jgi:two-component system, NarL family, nitrate/nitrite response regulator NarL
VVVRGVERTLEVVVVANVRLYTEGVCLLLEREPGIEVVGVSSHQEALETVASLRPDVALIDGATPSCLALVRAMRAAARRTRVVALGLSGVDREIVNCAEAGISGYVTRAGSRSDLVAAIFAAARGEAHCSARVAGTLLERVATLAREKRGPSRERLTRRELQVARLLNEGLSNKEIASRLCIEVPTVKSHVHSILRKLGARRRGEAAARIRALSV